MRKYIFFLFFREKSERRTKTGLTSVYSDAGLLNTHTLDSLFLGGTSFIGQSTTKQPNDTMMYILL